MSGFQAVNTTTLAVPDAPAPRAGETTPTTPTPGKFFVSQRSPADSRSEDPAAKTPTRDSFSGLAGQKPLPSSPFTPSHSIDASPNPDGGLSKASSRRSTKSEGSQDVKMGDEEDGQPAGSDNESANSETNGRPSKKKKGQRFFCTDFPPCTLSFTRSEHLARHIRKHTGERPFQCHCSRRFSRLDNLRQHAQTVHVNEDIPGDSLAATGTRFQRQIRTDRVRPPNRARASTLGSQGGHSRGHSRNLSTSSIASTASSVSTISTRDDPRRRPPPLAMASDGPSRARLSLETFNAPLMGGPGPTLPNYGNHSPGGLSTPTSTSYSGTGSPRFPSGMQSPSSSAPRLAWGSRTPGRRLSVPSGTNPFQAPPNAQSPYISPLPSSTNSTFSTNSSIYASPTNPSFAEGRRDSSSTLDADWRRRTWHPSTYTGIGPRPATSGLSYYQTPDAPRPLFSNQPAASQTTRLPGIESFDHAPPPPSITRRQPSPMQIDNPTRPPPPSLAGPFEPSVSRPDERRSHTSWDLSVQRGISRLDITSPPPPREAVLGWPESSSAPNQPPATHATTAPAQSFYSQVQAPPAQEQEQNPAEPPVTPRRNKRHAWYHGPLSSTQPSTSQSHSYQSNQSSFRTQRTSPEDSSSSEGVPTPSSSMGEYHPAIVHSNGYIESHPPGAPVDEQQKPALTQSFATERSALGGPARPHRPTGQPQLESPFTFRTETDRPHSISGPAGLGIMAPRQEPAHDMRRLEALVAVATGEQQVANALQ